MKFCEVNCLVKNKIKVTFCGKSSEDVTNSMYLLEYNNKKVLLDCGLYQSSSPNLIKAYNVNHRNYKIPFKDLDAIIISHNHSDHQALLPYAYSKGATCPTYAPKNSLPIMRIMMEDSVKIFESDTEKLRRKYNINATMLYNQEDIEVALAHVQELGFHNKYQILDDTKLELFHAGHIVNASQIRLEFNIGKTIKSLGYTGDVGSNISKNYINDYESLPYCDVIIGEATYSGDLRNHGMKDYLKDIEKIQTVVRECCLENNNKVVFGSFSLGRLQDILTELYKLYGEDESFVIPILVDAPLGIKISDVYGGLVEKNKDLWDKVRSWGNIVWIKEFETSKYYQGLKTPQILISTSNMLTAGRILPWLKACLPNSNNRICFCGYTGDSESLAWKIKNNKHYVLIDGERIRNKAGITCLSSFSSHASRQELLQRYSDMNYQKLFLVHSDFENKVIFAEIIKDELSKKNKTSKVYTPTMGDEIKF